MSVENNKSNNKRNTFSYEFKKNNVTLQEVENESTTDLRTENLN